MNIFPTVYDEQKAIYPTKLVPVLLEQIILTAFLIVLSHATGYTFSVLEISNGFAINILAEIGKERVILLLLVILPVPHCTSSKGG